MSKELIKSEDKFSFVKIATSENGRTQLIKHYSGLTLNKIIENKYPTLSEVSRKFGSEKTEYVISLLVKDINRSFKGKITPSDQEEISLELTNSIFRNLSLEDVYYALRELKLNKIHNKNLNANMILASIKSHFEEKTKAIVKINQNKHLVLQSKEKAIFGSERTSEAKNLKEITERTKFAEATKKYNQEKNSSSKNK